MAPKLPEKRPRDAGRPPPKKRGARTPAKAAKPSAKKTGNVSKAADGDRIAKYMARAGIASRRDCEKLILEGRVKVNGVVLDTPAFKVTANDSVLFDNKPVARREPPRVWRYHKPEGLVAMARFSSASLVRDKRKKCPRIVFAK